MVNDYPKHPEDYKAIVISGSDYDAYGDLQWIKDLRVWINQVIDLGGPKFVGVCYGH